ncbi:TauD/TfdA family dioxygenase [Aeromicrobium sp. UC242_57]|uniref:TauD/TfdA family dioxygenase n=1 Tax=Aeromicrobium sp. UC242_57 TaxID=3374624 RepID=UPI0037BDA57B
MVSSAPMPGCQWSSAPRSTPVFRELTAEQVEVLHLFDEISQEPGLAIDMDFQPGDVQWLLNYAALHSRTSFEDFPERERRRHLLRLWLKRDVGRPLVPEFGKHVVVMGEPTTPVQAGGRFSINDVVQVNDDWGN